MLQQVALFLGAAVLFVPLFKRLKLGAVLGYLAAGLVIGPYGLGYAQDVDDVLHLSEFGVVLLLFLIGLELEPARLWQLRRQVFGLGAAQVLLSAALLAPLVRLLGLDWPAAIAVGFALASSSTALVLQVLQERQELGSRHGQAAFAVLLFQDLSVIPLLAVIPMLGPSPAEHASWLGALRALAAVALVIAAGRFLLRPLLRRLAGTGVPEIFTAAALLLVIGVSLAMEAVGLSMSLGAFLAGVLLADSEYRHELQADLEPFKGLLLGLFFIAVGMGTDLRLLLSHGALLAGLVAGLVTLKAAVLYGLARALRGPHQGALRLAAVLAQGGEFAFVLFGVMETSGLVADATLALLTMAVTLSMLLTPALYALLSTLLKQPPPAPFDEISTHATPVVIAGFGPFGQIIGRVLRLKKITFTVLDKNAQHVDFVRSFGNPVFYSDAARPEVLRAAHAGTAELFVVAIADETESLRVVAAVRAFSPNLRIMAVARTRQHALKLMGHGVAHEDLIRRAYFSSLEMTRRVLTALGVADAQAQRAVDAFYEKDQETLLRQQAGPQDDATLRQNAKQFSEELEQLFEADQEAEDAAEAEAKGPSRSAA